MSTQLWLPGTTGPAEDLVERIHKRIEQFAADAGVDQAFVEVELADGARYAVEALSPEPGFGFVTIRPQAGEDTPGELIIPVGSIKRIELSRAAEEHGRIGFSLPSS